MVTDPSKQNLGFTGVIIAGASSPTVTWQWDGWRLSLVEPVITLRNTLDPIICLPCIFVFRCNQTHLCKHHPKANTEKMCGLPNHTEPFTRWNFVVLLVVESTQGSSPDSNRIGIWIQGLGLVGIHGSLRGDAVPVVQRKLGAVWTDLPGNMNQKFHN